MVKQHDIFAVVPKFELQLAEKQVRSSCCKQKEGVFLYLSFSLFLVLLVVAIFLLGRWASSLVSCVCGYTLG